MNDKELKKLQAKWDRILAKKGLSICQPIVDNSEGEMAEFDQKTYANNNVVNHGSPSDARRIDRNRLRGKVDGSDLFMSAHQIKKVRTREREVPVWVLSDAEVQKVLLRSFPNLNTNLKQRKAAGRWARIIHLYYRMKRPNSQVAKEMGVTVNALKMTLKGIRRVARGRRFDNRGKLKSK